MDHSSFTLLVERSKAATTLLGRPINLEDRTKWLWSFLVGNQRLLYCDIGDIELTILSMCFSSVSAMSA
jgi:hypothetical protein